MKKLLLAVSMALSIAAIAAEEAVVVPSQPVCIRGLTPERAVYDQAGTLQSYVCVRKKPCELIQDCSIITLGGKEICIQTANFSKAAKPASAMVPPPCGTPWYIENYNCCKK